MYTNTKYGPSQPRAMGCGLFWGLTPVATHAHADARAMGCGLFWGLTPVQYAVATHG